MRERLRPSLDSWHFWVAVAYFGLVVMTVVVWANYSRVSKEERRTAIVAAERGADIAAQYQQCIKSIPLLRKFNRFVAGVQLEHATLLRNAVATHRATPPGSDVYRAQVGNIIRLREANDAVTGLALPVVTVHQCQLARDRHTSNS